MTILLILISFIIISCVLSSKLSGKLGMPMLLLFILLGMLMGSDGILQIPFDDYELAESVCSVALIFIIFYGGFGTKWSAAKPIINKAILLSSLGTILTAGLVGLFCYKILSFDLLESFLIGGVVSSTDAASVFSILRFKKLNLKDNTASLLEIESGSNDPFAYMLMVIILSLMNNPTADAGFALLIVKQVFFGVFFGAAIPLLTIKFLKKVSLDLSGFNAIFMVAVAMLAYALPASLDGNGYLSAYLAGIILGNNELRNKQELVGFFDGTTGLWQMILFFSLGLLSFPSRLPQIALPAMGITLFLTFVARPLAVFAILLPFKSSWQQALLVSWAGLRGAASIVFSIMVVINPVANSLDVFHIVFFIVLCSILLQGALLPWVARRLDMIDDTTNVLHTFNDFIDETPLECIQFTIPQDHPWVGKTISSLSLPPNTLLVLLLRGKQRFAPKGQLELLAEDTLVLSGHSLQEGQNVELTEKRVEENSRWVNKTLAEIAMRDQLVIMVRRQGESLVPTGDTRLLVNDILVIMDNRLLP